MDSQGDAKLEGLTKKYIEFLKDRFNKIMLDWTPTKIINKPQANLTIGDSGLDMLISSKSLFSSKPMFRLLVIPNKFKTAEEWEKEMGELKKKFDVYTVIVLVGHDTTESVVNYVIKFNNDMASMFLVELETGLFKTDSKAITRSYVRWFDPKSQPVSTKSRLLQLSQGGRLHVDRVREEYNFTYGQALDFLHSCKFLKRDGLTENYNFR